MKEGSLRTPPPTPDDAVVRKNSAGLDVQCSRSSGGTSTQECGISPTTSPLQQYNVVVVVFCIDFSQDDW